MPELQWDELDFLECLEAIPEVEEPWKTRYVYKVYKDELILTVVVRPLEGVIFLSLGQAASDDFLVEFTALVRGPIRYVHDKRGEYIELSDCLLMPTTSSHFRLMRHPSTQANAMDRFRPGWTIELSVKPHIQIRYLD